MLARCAVLLLLAGPAVADDRPPGCLLRLGSDRFRFPGSAERCGSSVDGRWLFVLDGIRGRVFDAGTGRIVWGERETDTCVDIVFDRAGRLAVLLSNPDSGMRVERYAPGRWDTPVAVARLTGLPKEYSDPRLDEYADVVGMPAGRRLWLFDAHSGRPTANPKVPGKPEFAVFSHCGRWIVTGGEPAGRLFFLDRLTGQVVARLKPKEQMTAACFYPAAGGMAIAFGPHIDLYAVPGGQRLWRRTPPEPPEDMIEVGRHLAIVSMGRGRGGDPFRWRVRLYDPASNAVLWTADRLPDLHRSLYPSADGRTLIGVDGDGRLVQLDAATGRRIPAGSADRAGELDSLRFLSDGRLAGTGANGWAVWDPTIGVRTRLAAVPDGATVELSPDGTRFAIDTRDGVRLAEARTGRTLRLLPVSDGVSGFTFTRDGRLVGTGGMVRVWPLAAAVPPRTIYLNDAADGTVSADGRRLILRTVEGDENDLRFHLVRYDLRSSRPLGKERLPGPPRVLLLSADGRRGVVIGYTTGDDGRDYLRLLDVDTGRAVREYPLPGNLRASTMSADGRMLAHAESDGVIHVTELTTGGQRARFELPGWCDVHSLTIRPDGRRLASSATTGTLDVWDLETPPPGTPTDPAELWALLRHGEAASAFATVRMLSARPDIGLPLLRAKLQPVPAMDMGKVDRWITDLDSPRYAVRAAADAGLRAVGRPAAARLRERLATATSPEARTRLTELVAAAERLTPDVLRVLRAVEAVERIAADRHQPPAVRAEAVRLLEAWAGGASPAPLTDEARAAWERVR